ncbi:MAG: hypothetical protein KGR26_13725 [Cyanobacteria bacterium REEB65]|nr:hypothetical protein [Cyanobacteria bacterium REEB65]
MSKPAPSTKATVQPLKPQAACACGETRVRVPYVERAFEIFQVNPELTLTWLEDGHDVEAHQSRLAAARCYGCGAKRNVSHLEVK